MAELGPELAIGGPLSPAALRARVYRYQLLLRKYWWLPVMVLSASLLVQGVRYFLSDPLFVSTGRMMVAPRIMTKESTVYTEELTNYFGTQVSLMQSDEIKRRAGRSVEASHPELKGTMAELAVQQEPKASIFILKVTSPDPKYSQLFADACMSEFLEFKREMRGETSQKTVDAVAKQLTELEKTIADLDQRIFQFKQDNNVIFLQEQGNYVGSYLVDLNKQLAELKKEAQLLDLMNIDQTLEREAQGTEATPGKDGAGSAALVEGPQSEYIQTKRQLQKAKARLEQMSKYLRPKHPKILALKDEITRSERKLEIVRQQSRESVQEKRQAIQLQISNLEKIVAESETKALEVGRKMAEFEKLKTERDRQKQLYDSLLGTVQNVNVSQDVSQFDVNILEQATPAISIKPGAVRTLLLGLGVGLILSGALLFLLDRFNDRVSTVVELTEHFNEPIYGQVPEEVADADGRLPLLTPQDTRHVYAESFRNIRSSLRFVGVDGKKKNRVILVTSPTPGDGKSTITANLALTLSFATTNKILLIDGDMRRGGLHRLFGLEGEPGLAEVLGGQADWRKVVQPTRYPNLSFLSAGEPTGHPGELIFSAACENLMEELGREFEVVIFDTAPVLAVDDTPSLAPKADGTLVVYRAGRTSCRLMRNSLEALYSRNAKVLGIIFNGVDPKQPEYGYYKYTEYYYSKTVSRKREPAAATNGATPEKVERSEAASPEAPSLATANGNGDGPPHVTVKKT
ncbi:MAG: polysaccharide biosynthesis tyrosine autokinase [Verrucomicrobia bacterium]|nr:polysaccharide biosynthesis tyrosine autokinase [Verrucomicrobiota bacterium]NDA25827.1 polysaccharide biosynthesis tyrosine autokinase [Verrucomicrobiota bacterium]